MDETEQSQSRKKAQNKVFFRGGFYWIAAGAVILSAVVICYSRVFTTVEGQYTFIGQNVLNILIIAAIAVQALIYRRQWDVMDRQWRDSQRAQVGIKEVVVPHPQKSRNPWLKIQNTGKLSADDVGVEIQIILLCPPSTIKKYSNYPFQPVYAPDMIWVNFLRTKLFSAGVCFDVEVPLEETLQELLMRTIHNGEARVIVQVRLKYWDGFVLDESDYAFRWDSGWKSWPVWTRGDLPSRIAEEQARYHPS